MLEEAYLPSRIEGRDDHVQALADCLAPALAGRKPFHAWVHGPPGSGKSALVRSIFARFDPRVPAVLVNGLQRRTFYAVADQVLDELRVLAGDEKDTSWKLELLARHARDPLLIAVDEVDQLPLGERNALLYNLAALDRVGLVLLSQSRAAGEELDTRVLSRLNPRVIGLGPFPEPVLVAILRERASTALRPESWCAATIEQIARRAEGDARLAIQTLRAASYRAEYRNAPVVEEQDVDQALRTLEIRNLKRLYVLRKLPAQERLVYDLVREAGRISTTDLLRLWRARCRELGLEPLAHRTFKDYHLRLRQLGLLRYARGRGGSFLLEVAS